METLKLGGTGGVLGTMNSLGAAFAEANAGVTVSILQSLGSGGGIKAVLTGAIDIALSTRPLNDKERSLGAKAIAYAITPVVLATPKRNPKTGVTSEELVATFAGKQATWPDCTVIALVIRRPPSHYSRTVTACQN